MHIQIVTPNLGPVGKLADAELVFDDTDGVLAGTKLVGFAVWEGRESGTLHVTLPARQYTGQRRAAAVHPRAPGRGQPQHDRAAAHGHRARVPAERQARGLTRGGGRAGGLVRRVERRHRHPALNAAMDAAERAMTA